MELKIPVSKWPKKHKFKIKIKLKKKVCTVWAG